MIQLHDDFSRIWRKAWSFRLAILTGVLSAITVIMGVFVGCDTSALFMGVFILVSVAASVAGFATAAARLVAQPKMYQAEKR